MRFSLGGSQGLGFRVRFSLGFRVCGFRVCGLGLRV